MPIFVAPYHLSSSYAPDIYYESLTLLLVNPKIVLIYLCLRIISRLKVDSPEFSSIVAVHV